MSFGERLQMLRRGNNLTQEEFAQQLKVSRQAVSKWESSRGYPEIEKIIYICNYYGATMDELFMDEVPTAQSKQQEAAPQAGAESPVALERKPLKKAFGNFFSNLSPRDQHTFGVVAVTVLLVLLILFCLFCVTISKGETEQMVYKLVWLGLLVLFAVGEAVTVGLTSIWFAVGSLLALVCALLGGPLWLQITLFILASAGSLLAFRPLAHKLINSQVEPTNADRIIGNEAIVTEAIDNLQGVGAVRIAGMVWSARSQDEDPIPAGTLVRVLRIEGVKVYVEKIEEETTCQ